MLSEPLLSADAPWKQRFRIPTFRFTQIAERAPLKGLVCTNSTGIYQLHAWDVRTGELRAITKKPEGLASGFLSPDGRHVYYIHDRHGDETGHYVRIPYEGGEQEDITPELEPYSSWSFQFSSAGNRLAFMTATSKGFRAYTIDVGLDGSLGAPQEVYSSSAIAFGPILSQDGNTGVVMSSERSGKLQFSMVAMNLGTGETTAEVWDGPETTVAALAFSPVPGDARVLAVTDRTGTQRPFLWDVATGERQDIKLKELQGDVDGVAWSPDGKQVILCQIHGAVQQLYRYDLEDGSLTPLDHPSGSFGAGEHTPVYYASGSEIFAQWQDSVHPSGVIALDPKTGKMTRTVLAAGTAPEGRRWRSISFTSSDGEQIQAWLATPEGDGPFPTILDTHGGPEAVTTESFAPRAQLWLDHGFAFLTVNYRGSTTFGREFKEKIWYNPGHWEVEDMETGYRWLVDNGVAVPHEVLLTGWSYGGYLTLQALGTKPELWAGGMAGVAVADWVSQYEDESDVMRGIDIPFMGGTPEEQPEVYRLASPITYCEAVRAPVVIIQGNNDTRCPPRQVALYQERMKALGKPCDVHWFDAGHMVGPVEQAIEHQEIFLRFAYSVLSSTPAHAPV